ncbi:hypothetical protein N7512_008996 [Penicillium capsulatum]|nr:hypothetical protein N7512_008996 [Penicillium capsulatum]
MRQFSPNSKGGTDHVSIQIRPALDEPDLRSMIGDRFPRLRHHAAISPVTCSPGYNPLVTWHFTMPFSFLKTANETEEDLVVQNTAERYLSKDSLQALLERLFPTQKDFNIRVSRRIQ